MAKRCVITTEQYHIEVTSFGNPIQEVTVRPLKGMEGFAVSAELTIGREEQQEEEIQYMYTEEEKKKYREYRAFWGYIKFIIKDTMRWKEYWKDYQYGENTE